MYFETKTGDMKNSLWNKFRYSPLLLDSHSYKAFTLSTKKNQVKCTFSVSRHQSFNNNMDINIKVPAQEEAGPFQRQAGSLLA
jgi:hypothetical protein